MKDNPARKKNNKTKQNKTKKKIVRSQVFPQSYIQQYYVHTKIVILLPFQIIILIQVLDKSIFDCDCDSQIQNTDLKNV